MMAGSQLRSWPEKQDSDTKMSHKQEVATLQHRHQHTVKLRFYQKARKRTSQVSGCPETIKPT